MVGTAVTMLSAVTRIAIDGGGPDVFKPFVEKQMTTWSKFIKDNNITE
mgnify:CR=1 FL=1